MNAKLFINYRREDSAPYAGRLYDRLTAHFGEDQVFIDIDQIEPGEDFVEAINRKVRACDIAIVAIGPNWLRATDASGQRRIDDEEDFVRTEIVAALDRKIRVIPVLVGGGRMPGRHDLPEALAPLSRRNAIELSETRFHADVTRLIEAIEKSFAEAEAASLAEEQRQAAQLAELKLTEEKRAAEAEATRLADEKSKPDEAARAAAEKRKAAEPAEHARLANEQRIRQDRPYRESQRSQQGSVATARDQTTPMKSTKSERGNNAAIQRAYTRTTPATAPITSLSRIAALNKTAAWIRKRPIIATGVGIAVILLLTITAWLTMPYLVPGVREARYIANLQKKAGQGDAEAQGSLGLFYLEGLHVSKDLGKGAELLQKSADQGNVYSQAILGMFYERESVPKDLGKAAELYQKAADQGFADAQEHLGELYQWGQGVPKDLDKARELFQKAADQGNELAIEKLKKVQAR